MKRSTCHLILGQIADASFDCFPLRLCLIQWIGKDNHVQCLLSPARGGKGTPMCLLRLAELKASVSGEDLHVGSHYIHCDPAVGQNRQNRVPQHGYQKS